MKVGMRLVPHAHALHGRFDQMPLDSRTFSLGSKSQQRHRKSEELRAI